MDTLRVLLPPATTALVWALIPGIALGAEALARALPRVGSGAAPGQSLRDPSWRERWPFVITAAVILAFAWWRFGPSRAFLSAAGGGTLLLIVAAIDWRYRVIFARVLLAGGLGSLGIAALDLPATATLVESLVVGSVTWAMSAALYLALRSVYQPVLPVDCTPLGFGDVLLAAMIGTMLGHQTAWALALGAVLAGAATLGAAIAGRVKRHDPIPLGSFLCWGAIVVLLLR